jgi:peptide deformylase
MAILNIVKEGDPLLRKRCRPVTEITPRILTLLDDMRETLIEANGAGLAAPQVGILRRIALVDLGEEIVELINPEILEESDEKVTYSEGCLSIPNIYCDVLRPAKMTLRYYNENFEQVTETLDKFACRMVQHELSHLDGNLFTDNVPPIRRKMIASKLQNIAKGKVHPHYNSKLK